MGFVADLLRLQADGLWGAAVMMASPAFDPDRRAPKGDGRHVLLVPGFMGPEMSLRPMAAFLSRIGYSPVMWGRGINVGHRSPEAAQRIFRWIAQRADRLAEASGRPVSIVGQSLGGVYARESAKIATSVDAVVTLGSPAYLTQENARNGVNAAVQRMFTAATGIRAHQHVGDPRYGELDTDPDCRVTSIYSPYDAVVSPSAAKIPDHRLSDSRKNVMVRAPHMGMGAHPGCLLAVAEALSP